MGDVFRIETDCIILAWGEDRARERTLVDGSAPSPGRLAITARRPGLQFLPGMWRAGVPSAVAGDPAQTVGPRLFEETDYRIFLQSRDGRPATLVHRDPLLTRGLSAEQRGALVHGSINFHSQVGRSAFSVLADGHPEFDFEVEVFPTKLDYESDYRQMLAEVQEIMTGLALEYLRSTFRLGAVTAVPQPTHLEWLTLLGQVVGTLTQAVQHIAQRPIRGLTREPVQVRADQVKRVDSAMRAAIRRGAGSRETVWTAYGVPVRQRLQETRPRPTLDTPEHRWIAAQLDRIRRRLGEVLQQEAALRPNERRTRTQAELSRLESGMARLLRTEPLAAAEGQPPPGFASLQLIGAPGYREAYQSCLVLSLGLRVMQGPMQLSVKDLSLLYEYWCYLALLRLVAQETGRTVPPKSLLAVTQEGVQVLLGRGRQTDVRFDTGRDRRVTVTYNPEFRGNHMLIPQRPDMMVSIEDRSWPRLRLLLDAKYRLDASPEYRDQYGSPGPPGDALNVLHRYRDAILESAPEPVDGRPKRTVVQAAAVFPYSEAEPGQFANSRLWQSLDRIGIGAIPLLPGAEGYLQEWLRGALHGGGWQLADRVVDHSTRERVVAWRQAAAEPVLIGTLRGGHEAEHLQWIREHRRYYMPVLTTQRRQYAAKLVALYSPLALRARGAVTHAAAVEGLEVVRRGEIHTPWPSHMDSSRLCVLYHLGDVSEIRRPVENRGPDERGQRVPGHRWTSRLAFERARTLAELLLETEPEWRLYEDLTAIDATFELEPSPPRLLLPDDPAGRVWFRCEGANLRVRYTGDSGFLVSMPDRMPVYRAHAEDVVAIVERRIGRSG